MEPVSMRVPEDDAKALIEREALRRLAVRSPEVSLTYSVADLDKFVGACERNAIRSNRI